MLQRIKSIAVLECSHLNYEKGQIEALSPHLLWLLWEISETFKLVNQTTPTLLSIYVIKYV